ncbi:prepilin-type N-terminal cleavage/methylation domain-containing protein [bacterium]|nr:prepilin-type N-terminal cleavage/methylation domain-containing protein [bacterium]
MRKKGFTLIELLTAIAIFVVLLGILFIPVSSSLRSIREANMYVALQDAAKDLAERFKKEVPTAINAFDPSSPIVIGIDPQGNYIWAPYAKLDLVLPMKELYCEICGSVTPYPTFEPSPPYTCPNCGNSDQSTLHLRLHRPLTSKSTITRFFIGLREPGVWDDNLKDYTAVRPYENVELRIGSAYNLFTLYKVEFNPNDPRFANWRNQDFFYDLNTAPDGKTYMYHWKKNAVSLTPPDLDVVDVWQDANGVYHFTPLLSFLPRFVQEVLSAPSGSYTYIASLGLWAGIQNDNTQLLKQIYPNPYSDWPHVVVMHWDGGSGTWIYDYDSWITDPSNPASPWADVLQRYLTWDSRRGMVNFAFWAQRTIPADGISYTYSIPAPSDPVSNQPIPNAYLLLRSEVVKVNGVTCKRVDVNPQTYVDVSGNRLYEYTIDYDKAIITFNPQNPPLQGDVIEVTYYWTTLQRGDLVWVHYPSCQEIMVAIGSEKAFTPERKYPFWIVHTIKVENVRR